jgi:hypothetical protein
MCCEASGNLIFPARKIAQIPQATGVAVRDTDVSNGADSRTF